MTGVGAAVGLFLAYGIISLSLVLKVVGFGSFRSVAGAGLHSL